MSFFNSTARDPQMTPQLKQALAEVEGMQNMFRHMSRQCYEKCITHKMRPDLNIGEMRCVDRCALKYMESLMVTGNVFRMVEMGKQNMA
ncbi:MAG: hypothetical protein MHM6MM_007524 [Cercozoa sp. M6MM]